MRSTMIELQKNGVVLFIKNYIKSNGNIQITEEYIKQTLMYQNAKIIKELGPIISVSSDSASASAMLVLVLVVVLVLVTIMDVQEESDIKPLQQGGSGEIFENALKYFSSKISETDYASDSIHDKLVNSKYLTEYLETTPLSENDSLRKAFFPEQKNQNENDSILEN